MENVSNNCVFEGMTSVSALINAAERQLPSARRYIKFYFDVDNITKKNRQVDFIVNKSKQFGYEHAAISSDEMDRLTSGKTHGGFAAVCEPRVLSPLTLQDIVENGVYFILEGIEDPFNFGYTLRSLYAAGVDGVILPERNWFTAAGTVAKSSAGCSELIPAYSGPLTAAVTLLKSRGYSIVSAGIRNSVSLFEAGLTAPLAVIIGGEKRGISASLLSLSGLNVRIPYGRNFIGSLPTSAAAAVLAFSIAENNKKQ